MAKQPTQHNPPPEFNDSLRSTGRSMGQSPPRLPDRLSVRRLFLALLEQMVRHRPLAFWSAVWMVPLLMAIVAVTALMTPEYAAQKLPPPPSPSLSPAPTATQPPVQAVSTTSIAPVDDRRSVTTPRSDLSRWSLGAIVLTCAISSVLISRWLNRPQKHPRLLAKEPPRTVKPSQPTPSATVRGRKAINPNKTTVPSVPSPPQPAAVSRQFPTYRAFTYPAAAPSGSGHQAFKQQQTTPKVTLVPSSESHPLDWSEDSLAEMMDIRKRRSLSSWL